MPNNIQNEETKSFTPEWLTINEAIEMIRKKSNIKIKKSDIYRYALYGKITLSIYFQSQFILRKIKISSNKITLKQVGDALIERICMLEKSCFLKGINLALSTTGDYIYPPKRIVDTVLLGFELVIVQQLLAQTLRIPNPITGAKGINYGITVILSGDLYQVFERITWYERTTHQVMKLSKKSASEISTALPPNNLKKYSVENYFPMFSLPRDACFVIKKSEIEKIITMLDNNATFPKNSTRMSTPVSRMFWLACKHNELISPLMRQPYKLLSIFEQWALADGITDHLSGDTLKKALERGSPASNLSSN